MKISQYQHFTFQENSPMQINDLMVISVSRYEIFRNFFTYFVTFFYLSLILNFDLYIKIYVHIVLIPISIILFF